MPGKQSAEYYRNYRRRVKQRRMQRQTNLEDIILGNKPAKTNYSPLEYLLAVMNDETADPDRRCRAAVAAAPYCHQNISRKTAEEKLGVKEQRERAAEDASNGKFGPAPEPTKH